MSRTTKRDDDDKPKFETAKLYYEHLASKLKRADELAFAQKRRRREEEEDEE
jgi:hypothetical protein